LAAEAATGGDGAGALDGLTGVTFGYMKWCGRIYPNRRLSARFLTRAKRDIRHAAALPSLRWPLVRGGYLRLGTQVRYLRVPCTTRPEAVFATILTV
jgi:hypothetical protein